MDRPTQRREREGERKTSVDCKKKKKKNKRKKKKTRRNKERKERGEKKREEEMSMAEEKTVAPTAIPSSRSSSYSGGPAWPGPTAGRSRRCSPYASAGRS